MVAIPCILLAVASPLQSAADYVFTDISNREWMVGSSIGIMGPEPVPTGRPASGEDVIYLNEAFEEVRQIAGSGPDSVRARASGNTRPVPILDDTRARYAPWTAAHGMLADNTNAAGSTCGSIMRTGWTPPDGVGGGFLAPSNGVGRFARSVVHGSGGAPTDAIPALEPLALRRQFALISTNVAAFYRALGDIGGVAFDRTAADTGTNVTVCADVDTHTSCRFNADDGAFSYVTASETNTLTFTGCRAMSLARRRTSARWVVSGGTTYVSEPMHGGGGYECAAASECAAPVFGDSLAGADALGVVAAWCLFRCSYDWQVQVCTGAASFSNAVCVSTNVHLAVRQGEVDLSEDGGRVVARFTPDMAAAVAAVRSAITGEGWTLPDGLADPPAPTWEGRGADEADTLTSYALASYDIEPCAIALILSVEWRSKFQTLKEQ